MKQNPTIYLIDKNYTFDSVISEITKHLEVSNITPVEKDLDLNDYKVKLLIQESDEKESEWSSFLPKKHLNGVSLEYKMPSLVMFIDTNPDVYAIIGGSFYPYLLPFLDMSYGLNTYSRIMDPVKDEIVTIKTRGVTGLRAGMHEQFKENYHVMDYMKFGKIPTELKIKLSNEKSDLLFDLFKTNRSPNIVLKISSGFNLNKKITYPELGKLIEILVYIKNKFKPNDFFSSYKEIVDKKLISKSLKPAVINKLYNEKDDIIRGKVTNFDLCYPNKIEEFYSADEYILKRKIEKNRYHSIITTQDKNQILPSFFKYLTENKLDTSLHKFTNEIYNTHLYSYTSNKKTPIQTALIYHLNTELILADIGTYIFIDSKWYKLRSIFVNEMNERCNEILTNNNLYNSVLNEKWNKKEKGKRENEGTYNLKYLKDNYLVLDTITIDSIELADIIHIQDGTIYICHVKYGFSTDLRELYSQIISSARRLKNDLKNEKNPYLRSIYKHLKEKRRNSNYSESDFVELFQTNKIKYVFGITGHLSNRNLFNHLSQYTSNIAKLSLIQCFTEMRTEYYDIDIEVINNSNCFN